MPKNSCATTLGSLRARHGFLRAKLVTTALVQIQLFAMLLRKSVAVPVNAPLDAAACDAVRRAIVKAKTSETTYNEWHLAISDKLPMLATLIELLANATVDLLCLHDHVVRHDGRLVDDPLRAMYLFVVATCYSSPAIFLQADDAHGTHVARAKELIGDEFIATAIELKLHNTGIREADLRAHEEAQCPAQQQAFKVRI